MLAICPPLEEARPVAGTQQRWYARLELGFEAPGDGRTVLVVGFAPLVAGFWTWGLG